MSFLFTAIVVVGSFIAGYIVRPMINEFSDKEVAFAKSKLIAIETVIKNDIDKEEDKIKKIVEVLKT